MLLLDFPLAHVTIFEWPMVSSRATNVRSLRTLRKFLNHGCTRMDADDRDSGQASA